MGRKDAETACDRCGEVVKAWDATELAERLAEHRTRNACRAKATQLRALAKGLAVIGAADAAENLRKAGYTIKMLKTGLKEIGASWSRSRDAEPYQLVEEAWVPHRVKVLYMAVAGVAHRDRIEALKLARSTGSAGKAIRAAAGLGDPIAVKTIIDANAGASEYANGDAVELKLSEAWVNAVYVRPHTQAGYHWVKREENVLGREKQQLVPSRMIRRPKLRRRKGAA